MKIQLPFQPDEPMHRSPFITLGAVIIYIIAHRLLAQLSVDSFVASALSIVPIILAGLVLGMRGGLLVGLLIALPLNTLLLNLDGSIGWNATVHTTEGATGTVILIAIGIIIGRMHDLQERVKCELAERLQAEEALKAANEELAQARDELEKRVRIRTAELAQANRDLETLLYVISHDLKEPLRAIQNFSRLVNHRYATQLDSKGQDYLQRIDRAAERLYVLFNDIVMLSQAQRMELPSQEVAATTIVQEVLARLEPHIKETAAVIHVSPDLPGLRANRTWAAQAIYNLVSNALKYIGDGAPPEVEIAAYCGPEGTGIAIKDRGPGVPAEHRDRIFQLFQRAVGREVEGTGIGLAIVSQVAQRHGGRAWVQPRPGGGSEFIVTFEPAGPANDVIES